LGSPVIRDSLSALHELRSVTARSSRDDPLNASNDGFADDRLEQRFLALEIEIERAFGNTRSLGDVLEPRRRESVLDERVERGIQDVGGAHFRFATAGGQRGLRGGDRSTG
jgi:hypothetical protein